MRLPHMCIGEFGIFSLTIAVWAGLCFGNQTMVPNVYVGGDFTMYLSGGASINGIGSWDNVHQKWNSVPNSPKSVGMLNAIAANGSKLYIGGQFNEVHKLKANSIVSYDTVSHTWGSLCDGVLGTISAVAVLGDVVYIAGNFQLVPECESSGHVNNVASFNVVTRTWDHLDSGLPGAIVDSLAVQSVANSTYVYLTGLKPDPKCTGLCPPTFPFISFHDAAGWHDMASSDTDPSNRYTVIAVNPYTEQVYVGGSFRFIGGHAPLFNLALWSPNLAQWTTVQSIFNFPGNTVYDMDFIDPAICADCMVVGGYLQDYYGPNGTMTILNNLALYNGSSWVPLGSGVTHVSPDLCVADTGTWRRFSCLRLGQLRGCVAYSACWLCFSCSTCPIRPVQKSPA
eukprot:TRINITY_DN3872_c0_g1_i3.p1 TRINITY_DN3872_c0_g1~~TRINITY_DN3872_c0_g1_i3.p1  ORF type:complete len:397 (+),score=122.83 TRINITY_DN3872_c0_g1_i3:263-1453(+)